MSDDEDDEYYYSLPNFSDYKDDQSSDNVSSSDRDVQSTASAEYVRVQLYPVVTWFGVLLMLLTVGLVGNSVIVVATSSLGRVAAAVGGCQRPCRLRRSASAVVVANLCVVHVASCLLLGPLEFAIVAENYVKRSVSPAACRAAAAVYHLLAGAVVTCFVLHSITRRRRLRHAFDVAVGSSRHSSKYRRSAPAGDGGTAAGASCLATCRQQLARLQCPAADNPSALDDAALTPAAPCHRKQMSAAEVATTSLPWFVGAVCSLVASADYSLSVDYDVCRQAVVYWRLGSRRYAWSSSAALGAGYAAALLCAVASLVVAFFRKRKQLASTLLRRDSMPRDRSSLLDADRRRRTSGVSGGSAPSAGDANSGDAISRHDPSNSSRKNVAQKLQRKQSGERAAASGNRKASQDKTETEEDDDTFDIKMRLKFQKKQRSSGRRHTVANIGLPDLAGRLRRGSLSDTGLTAAIAGSSPTGSGSGATTPDYHYVRKWSVDITALANQLENPKAAVAGRSGSYQFAELPGALKTSPPGRCPARRSSPVAARPTLPRIIAEVESGENEPSEKEGTSEQQQTDIKSASGSRQPQQRADNKLASSTIKESAEDRAETSAAESAGNQSNPAATSASETPADADNTTKETINKDEAAPKKKTSGDGCAERSNSTKSQIASGATPTTRRRPDLARHHNAVEHVSSLPLDPPSIIVSSLHVDEDPEPCSTNTEEDDDDDSSGAARVWTTSGATAASQLTKDTAASRLTKDTATSDRSSTSIAADDAGDENGATPGDDELRLRRASRELKRARRTCVLMTAALVFVLPFACVSVWNALADRSRRRNVGYNLSLAAGALMTVLAAACPPLLVWADRCLLSRILRLWTLVRRLRCVCYCNIGRGQNCFHSPRGRPDL